MANTPPLNIRDASVAAMIDLTSLADSLLATPEPIYLWREYVSTKYGPYRPGMGSKVQVNRLMPLESPNPDALSLYDAGTTRNALDISTNANLQALDWRKVEISVRRRRMPKPVSEKFETEQLSQLDIMMGHRINLRRNYNEYIDDLIRETYRAASCSTIYGGQIRNNAASMLNDPGSDGLNVAMLKEYKLRAAALRLRAFGSVAGGDAQALAGSYLGITDQNGINELEDDPVWRDYAIRAGDAARANLVKGFIGEFEQITIVKCDRMRTQNVGPSGVPFAAHEIILMATDPTLIEPAADSNSGQGFIGEYPVVLAQVGVPEVKKASEDNFGEDLIFTWYHTLGTKALEELTAADAAALTLTMGQGFPNKGVAATGSSRFIHTGVFI